MVEKMRNVSYIFYALITESKPKLFPRNYLFHTLLFGKEVFDNQLFLLRNIIPKGSNSLCGCLFLTLHSRFLLLLNFQVKEVAGGDRTVEYQNFDICQSVVFHPKILLIPEESFRFEFEGVFI